MTWFGRSSIVWLIITATLLLAPRSTSGDNSGGGGTSGGGDNSGGTSGGDTSGGGETLTVATWNLKNLLDDHDDPHCLDERNTPKPQKSIKKIARVLRRIDADVIAVQEIENEPVLRAMIDRHLPDMGYRHVVVEPTNSRYGIHLGVVSRVPIVSITSHRKCRLPVEPNDDVPPFFARDLLRVSLQATKTRRLELFVVHFKARRDDPRSNRWRMAEAKKGPANHPG